MKFLSYLTEDNNNAPFTKQDVAPYAKLLNTKHPLERASDKKLDSFFTYAETKIYYRTVTLRTDRNPQGHFYPKLASWARLNNTLEENGHVRRDSCTMAVKDVSALMDNFGQPYYLIPLGKFNYSWVNSPDFNYPSGSWDTEHLKDLLADGDIEGAEEMINANIFTNKGFSSAYQANREIWMNPKTYILIEKSRNFLSFWNELTK